MWMSVFFGHRRLRGHGHRSQRGPRAVQLGGKQQFQQFEQLQHSPNNNMVLVTEQEYHDTDCAGCSGGGGQLASVTQHVDASTTA